MPLGAGLAPAGLSPAGYGAPDAAPAPVTNVTLPDAITGLPQPGRLIDPTTQSYQYTADGRVVGVGLAQQLVQLAVKTILGSSVIPSLGMDFSRLQDKGANLLQTVTSVVTNAFAPIVSQKIVKLNSVDVQDYPGTPDRAVILVKWTNLTTNTEVTTTI